MWCPIRDCQSGPVQKITQHLKKVHKVAGVEMKRLEKEKRFAPLEAVKYQTLNPHTQMSAVRPLPLIQERQSTPAASKTKRKESIQCHRGGEIFE